MKEKKFAIGCAITFITIGIIILLFANFTNQLTNLLRETDMECNEVEEVCYQDLKEHVFYSVEAKNVIIYTGILTLLTLNFGAFSLYHFCINKNFINKNNDITLPKKKNIKKKKK